MNPSDLQPTNGTVSNASLVVFPGALSALVVVARGGVAFGAVPQPETVHNAIATAMITRKPHLRLLRTILVPGSRMEAVRCRFSRAIRDWVHQTWSNHSLLFQGETRGEGYVRIRDVRRDL